MDASRWSQGGGPRMTAPIRESLTLKPSSARLQGNENERQASSPTKSPPKSAAFQLQNIERDSFSAPKLKVSKAIPIKFPRGPGLSTGPDDDEDDLLLVPKVVPKTVNPTKPSITVKPITVKSIAGENAMEAPSSATTESTPTSANTLMDADEADMKTLALLTPAIAQKLSKIRSDRASATAQSVDATAGYFQSGKQLEAHKETAKQAERRKTVKFVEENVSEVEKPTEPQAAALTVGLLAATNPFTPNPGNKPFEPSNIRQSISRNKISNPASTELLIKAVSSKKRAEAQTAAPYWIQDITPLPAIELGCYLLVLKVSRDVPDQTALEFLVSCEQFRGHLLAFAPPRFAAVYELLTRHRVSLAVAARALPTVRPRIEAELDFWLTPPLVKSAPVPTRRQLSAMLKRRLGLIGCRAARSDDYLGLARAFLLRQEDFARWLKAHSNKNFNDTIAALTARDEAAVRGWPLSAVFWRGFWATVEDCFLAYLVHQIEHNCQRKGTDPLWPSTLGKGNSQPLLAAGVS